LASTFDGPRSPATDINIRIVIMYQHSKTAGSAPDHTMSLKHRYGGLAVAICLKHALFLQPASYFIIHLCTLTMVIKHVYGRGTEDIYTCSGKPPH
jgi:hypothetical protein